MTVTPLTRRGASSGSSGDAAASAAELKVTELKAGASGSTSASAPADSPAASYYGFDKKEVTRLLIQSLNDLGYSEIGHALGVTSGYDIESAEVARFRTAVLAGDWEAAEKWLRSIELQKASEIADMKFLLRRQHYLELLESGDKNAALAFLRAKISTLDGNRDELHNLSNMLLFPMAEVKASAKWDGAQGQSRSELLDVLQQYMSPTIVIPPHRLATLLEHAKSHQLSKALYCTGVEPFSLYKDFIGDRRLFPTVTTHILKEHLNEVWFLEFSHSGRYLASASADKRVIIWDVEREFTIQAILTGHSEGIVFLSWSPNDDYILTAGGKDKSVILWDPLSGSSIQTFTNSDMEAPVCAWMNDSQSFIVGSPAKKLVQFNLKGEEIYRWNDVKAITAMTTTPNGEKLVVICHVNDETFIYLYDMLTRDLMCNINLGKKTVTSVEASKDSRYALINVVPEEVHLWDLETYRIVRVYVGQVQDDLIIRSCFGGLDENFVLSGSQDSHIYIWSRDSTNLLEVLGGHTSVVNCVRWRPNHPAMFASASDDGTIRIWQPPRKR